MNTAGRQSGLSVLLLAALAACCASCASEPSLPVPATGIALQSHPIAGRRCKLYSDAEALGFKRKLESLNPQPPLDYTRIGIASNRISLYNVHNVVMNRDSRHWPTRHYYLLSHNYWMILYKDEYGSGTNGITSISIERTPRDMHPGCPQQSPAGDSLKAAPEE